MQVAGGDSWYNHTMPKKRVYSFDRTLPDGRVVSVCTPRMQHLRANITYVCDRGCPNCNRACGIAKSGVSENMPLSLFKKALQDCKAKGTRLTKIILTGGEPTMHPEFDGFADAAMEYKNTFSPSCNVWVGTYHHPLLFKKVERAVERNPGLLIMGNPKEKPRDHDYAPYLAPIDEPGTLPEDHFYRGCHFVASLCGMTVDYKGFWCCPVAPAIARVFGLDLAVKEFKDVSLASLTAQYDQACRRCGFYMMRKARGVERISKSWAEAIKAYASRRH